jgi:glutathione S-transferase
MKVYGTPTSPYVRRVRVVALELGVPLDLVDTRGPEGQAALRAVSPIWKVPVLVREGRETLYDSRAITAALLRDHGPGALRFAADLDAEANLVNVADAALDALTNAYQVEQGGVDVSAVPYLAKQRDRAAACLAWLSARLRGPWLTTDERLGPAEIALKVALDWMVFRGRFPVDDDPRLAAFRAFHEARPSFASTAPHG